MKLINTISTHTLLSKKTLLTAASVTTLTILFSANSISESHTDYAKVTHVEPIYERISYREPHRECHLEERVVHNKRSNSATPTILGALIGGAIGNELGHNKSNKRVGAVAGAILGGSIASDIGRGNRHHESSYTKTERVCHNSHTVKYKKELTGYEVHYKYHGRQYNTTMDQHPGKRIQVAVDVSPLNY